MKLALACVFSLFPAAGALLSQVTTDPSLSLGLVVALVTAAVAAAWRIGSMIGRMERRIMNRLSVGDRRFRRLERKLDLPEWDDELVDQDSRT